MKKFHEKKLYKKIVFFSSLFYLKKFGAPWCSSMRGGGVTYGAAVSEKPGAITPSVNLHIVTNKKNNNLKIFFSIK